MWSEGSFYNQMMLITHNQTWGKQSINQFPDLQRLADHLGLQAKHLQDTDACLFVIDKSQMLAALQTDSVIAVRADAFIARFNRLLWNIDEKMFSMLMIYFKEPLCPMPERLAYAERQGWLKSVTDWLSIRNTRDQLTCDYEGELLSHANALFVAHDYVPVLAGVAEHLRETVADLSDYDLVRHREKETASQSSIDAHVVYKQCGI